MLVKARGGGNKMFPPNRNKPKRIGGAPFSAAIPRAASLTRGVAGNAAAASLSAQRQPHSARSRSQKQGPNSDASAAGSAIGAEHAGNNHSATAPAREVMTPCTARAEQYYERLLGKSPASKGSMSARHDWTLVQEIDAVDYHAREDQQKRRERDKRVQNQQELQEQLDLQKRTAEHCRDVWKQWRAELEADVVQYQKEEEAKRVFTLEVQRRFNDERGRQLEEVRNRKNKQREAEIKLERDMMAAAEDAKRRQERIDETSKQKQKEAAKLLMHEAHIAQERRLEARKKENQRDREMSAKYQELLEAQDRERSKYFDGLRDKQQKLLASYEAGVGNALAEAAARDEERARKQHEQRLAKERVEAEERQRWRQQLAESGRVAVQQQLAAQAKRRKELRDEEQRFVEGQRRDAEVAEAEEEKEKRRKQQAVYANAEYLRRQIREKSEGTSVRMAAEDGMTDIERSINREKLTRACDPGRVDGMPALINRKRQEYRRQRQAITEPIMIPC